MARSLSFTLRIYIQIQMYTVTYYGVCVTYRRGLDWMIGFIDTLYTPLLTTGNYSAMANVRTLQFTVTHTLQFPVFTSRILATNFNTVVIPVSHMKSSCCYFANFPNPKTRLNSILLLPSSHPGRLESRNSANSSQLNSSL
jgi:hypothetical protein